jgi:hypothetical protein
VAFKNTYTGIRTDVNIYEMGKLISVPLYTIFITPEELVQLAEVPSFAVGDSHEDLADNLKKPPTKDWQRPLSDKRVTDIGDYFGSPVEKRLMPNPILLGESDAAQKKTHAKVDAVQLTDSAGKAVTDVWEITIENKGKHALWILDGQHRTFGLNSNKNTKNQKIPVVLLIKSKAYSMQFLAQIFTEVTTGAANLEEIHTNWMEYSFGMGNYSRGPVLTAPMNGSDKAMMTVIHLTTMGSVDGTANEFYNNIKFNPYDDSVLNSFNYTWESPKWVVCINSHYYSTKTPGTLSPNELAIQMVRFLRAAENLDIIAGNKSRIFGNVTKGAGRVSDVLLNWMIWQFLQNLDTLGSKTQTDWETHLKSQKWDKADWELRWATGSWSSRWGRYTNRAAEYVFKSIMSTTTLTTTPSSALTAASDFTIIGQTATPPKYGKGGILKSPGGKPGKKNMANEIGPGKLIHINGGKGKWTSGVNRRFVHFTVPVDGVSSISGLKGKDAKGLKVEEVIFIKYPKDIKTSTIDLSLFTSPIEFELYLCSFNEASESPEKFRLEW